MIQSVAYSGAYMEATAGRGGTGSGESGRDRVGPGGVGPGRVGWGGVGRIRVGLGSRLVEVSRVQCMCQCGVNREISMGQCGLSMGPVYGITIGSCWGHGGVGLGQWGNDGAM